MVHKTTRWPNASHKGSVVWMDAKNPTTAASMSFTPPLLQRADRGGEGLKGQEVTSLQTDHRPEVANHRPDTTKNQPEVDSHNLELVKHRALVVPSLGLGAHHQQDQHVPTIMEGKRRLFLGYCKATSLHQESQAGP